MDNFIKMSKYAGMREDLVQAGGGNSAYKMSKDEMVIKASGVQMADVTRDKGYAVVDPSVILKEFQRHKNISEMTMEDSDWLLDRAFIRGGKPSIETFLHSALGTYTLHTHPIVVNALTCREGGMETLKELFKDALMVPYATPGLELAKAYFTALRNGNENAKVVFLQNHGLLVNGESSEEVISTTEDVVTKIETALNLDMSNYHGVTELYRIIDRGIIWNVTDKHVLDVYAGKKGIWMHTFCPDCVVFLGKRICRTEDNFDKIQLQEFVERYGDPVVLEYKNNLYICAESVKKALEIQSVLSFSAQVMDINKSCRSHLLSDLEQDYLLHWSAEKYRRNMG